ncbi:MAG: type I restriction enzyme HsdR N-terminal domain-containing protein [Bacteroidota bacterium]|nr:type I restriction enzyme HsdR N-terminal domain-containing protein [Bacteroidota bacterium]
MIKIEFPKEQPKLRQNEGVKEIFDTIRKKWLILTPEEWVRQNIILFLLLTQNYPSSLISIEKGIKLVDLKKRYDIVVFNRQTLPWMIIECKEMNVSLSQKTMEQILRYHISIPAKYLIITNGSHCFGFEKRDDRFMEIDLFPEFDK